MMTKLALNFSRINMVQFVLRISGSKFYPKNGSFWLFLVNQKLRQKYPVDQRVNYIKVSHLRSPTNFKKSICKTKSFVLKLTANVLRITKV